MYKGYIFNTFTVYVAKRFTGYLSYTQFIRIGYALCIHTHYGIETKIEKLKHDKKMSFIDIISQPYPTIKENENYSITPVLPTIP